MTEIERPDREGDLEQAKHRYREHLMSAPFVDRGDVNGDLGRFSFRVDDDARSVLAIKQFAQRQFLDELTSGMHPETAGLTTAILVRQMREGEGLSAGLHRAIDRSSGLRVAEAAVARVLKSMEEGQPITSKNFSIGTLDLLVGPMPLGATLKLLAENRCAQLERLGEARPANLYFENEPLFNQTYLDSHLKGLPENHLAKQMARLPDALVDPFHFTSTLHQRDSRSLRHLYTQIVSGRLDSSGLPVSFPEVVDDRVVHRKAPLVEIRMKNANDGDTSIRFKEVGAVLRTDERREMFVPSPGDRFLVISPSNSAVIEPARLLEVDVTPGRVEMLRPVAENAEPAQQVVRALRLQHGAPANSASFQALYIPRSLS